MKNDKNEIAVAKKYLREVDRRNYAGPRLILAPFVFLWKLSVGFALLASIMMIAIPFKAALVTAVSKGVSKIGHPAEAGLLLSASADNSDIERSIAHGLNLEFGWDVQIKGPEKFGSEYSYFEHVVVPPSKLSRHRHSYIIDTLSHDAVNNLGDFYLLDPDPSWRLVLLLVQIDTEFDSDNPFSPLLQKRINLVYERALYPSRVYFDERGKISLVSTFALEPGGSKIDIRQIGEAIIRTNRVLLELIVPQIEKTQIEQKAMEDLMDWLNRKDRSPKQEVQPDILARLGTH